MSHFDFIPFFMIWKDTSQRKIWIDKTFLTVFRIGNNIKSDIIFMPLVEWTVFDILFVNISVSISWCIDYHAIYARCFIEMYRLFNRGMLIANNIYCRDMLYRWFFRERLATLPVIQHASMHFLWLVLPRQSSIDLTDMPYFCIFTTILVQ